MNLTKFERLLLANQYKILGLLDEKDSEEYDLIRTALENGYEAFYEDVFLQHISDGLKIEECKFVVDAMDMYATMQRAYRGLEDKSGISESNLEFAGFDGNHENSYMTYAEFLVHREGHWSILKRASSGLNSHTPTIELYRRRIQIWKQIPMEGRHQLTRDQLLSIMKVTASNI